jgi:predicted nucleic acid-binding protein
VAELFVDTSAWYPLADAGHPDHAAVADALARQIRDGARGGTTNLVVAETHALILRRGGREPALRFLNEVRSDPILVEASSPDLGSRAVVCASRPCRRLAIVETVRSDATAIRSPASRDSPRCMASPPPTLGENAAESARV